MPTDAQLLAFLVASFVLIQVPGPSLLFVIGRALTVGRRAALLSVVGNTAGVAVQVVLVAVGLASLVAASATAYTVLTLVGAAYVVWLGVQAVRHRGAARAALEAQEAGAFHPLDRGDLHALRTGAVVGVTNPKTVVFFAAFLPQFTDPGAAQAPQLLLLGAVFCLIALVSDSVWALAAATARAVIARRPRRLDAVSASGGVLMVGLGASLALGGRPST